MIYEPFDVLVVPFPFTDALDHRFVISKAGALSASDRRLVQQSLVSLFGPL